MLMPKQYRGQEGSFFKIVKGSSWHGKDAQTIFWMGQHWFLLVVIGFAIAGVLAFGAWRGLEGRGRKRRKSGGVYELVNREA